MIDETDAIVVTRVATAEDADTVLRMMTAFNQDEGIDITPEKMAAGVATLMADPAIGGVVLAEVGGVPAGYGLYSYAFDIEFGGRLGFLNELFVVQWRRNKGIGKVLLAAVEARLVEGGAHAVELLVRRENGGAQSLYRRHDYHFDPRLFMTKPLAR